MDFFHKTSATLDSAKWEDTHGTAPLYLMSDEQFHTFSRRQHLRCFAGLLRARRPEIRCQTVFVSRDSAPLSLNIFRRHLITH